MPRRIKYDARSIARLWIDRGVDVVAIEQGTKRPRGGKDWNKVKIKKDQLAEFFATNDSVGGLWGKIVDVDLDWDECLPIAEKLLPETFVYGRPNRRKSHYLFRLSRATKGVKWRLARKLADEDDLPVEVVLELRGAGSQTLLPGSRHPDGGFYSTDIDREFASIDIETLKNLCGQIAALAALVREYPRGGGRHDFIAALTGALVRGGFNDDEVTERVEAFLDAVGRKEDDRAQRLRTVGSVLIASKDKSSTYYGWNTLKDYVSERVLERARVWLVSRKRKGSIDEVPDEVVKVADELYAPFAGGAVDGLVGEVAQWAARRSFIEQPSFDVAVGLICTAIASRNKWVVEGWETPLQPYFMLAAPTAAGKESALESIGEFSRRVGLGATAVSGFQSYHAMLDRLAVERSAVWLWDEAARKLKSAMRSIGGPDYGTITHILSLYGKSTGTVAAMPARGTPIPELVNPFMIIAGATQPRLLVESVSANEMLVGLINRFVLFDAGDGAGRENLRRENYWPTRIDAMARRLRDTPRPVGDGFRTIRWGSVSVYNRMREFSNEMRTLAAREEFGELYGRAAQNAILVAGIVALGQSAGSISQGVCDWSIGLIEWSLGRWRSRFEGQLANTRIEADSKRVEQIISKARAMADKKGLNAKTRSLLSRGLMPRSLLVRSIRWVNARDLDLHIATLVAGELIAKGEIDGNEVYWPLVN